MGVDHLYDRLVEVMSPDDAGPRLVEEAASPADDEAGGVVANEALPKEELAGLLQECLGVA